jgi:uncharacterized RDD family membrane protein YckC
MNDIVRELAGLAIQLLVALLVWRYYRQKSFSLSEKYSTFGPRFWTGSVDACVLWPVTFAATALLTFGLPPMMAATLIIGQNLAWLLYTVFMHAKYGQTYGKMACRVRVVDFKTEGSLSFRQALLREGIPIALSLGAVGYEIQALFTGTLSQTQIVNGEFIRQKPFWLLASLPALWFIAEAITMLTNEKRRALHDYLAGTVVVRTNVT